jgi:hypothetical protein
MIDIVAQIDDGAIAEALGHSGFVLGKNARGDRFWVECACGYRSTGRTNVALAIQAGQHHLRKAVAEFKTSGVPLSGILDLSAKVHLTGGRAPGRTEDR